jgi:ABC-type multidrug transport system fused ATPase/permease subunit
MFRLKFLPTFALQKNALLKESDTPVLDVPPSVEQCLAGFHDAAPVRGFTKWTLWRDSIRSIQELLIKASLISVASSTCAAASTLAAMQILKTGQDLRSMWIFSLVFFAMSCTSQAVIVFTSRLRTWVGLGAEAFLVGLISKKLLRLSSVAAARQSSGNLKTLITSDVRNVGQFLDNAARNFIPAMAALAVIGPLLVYFSGRAGLFGLLVMTAVLPISLGLNAISTHYRIKSQTEIDKLTSLAGEWVRNVRLIRYLSWDAVFQHDVSVRLRRYLSIYVIQHLMSCLIYGLSGSWWMVSALGVIVIARALNYPLDLMAFFGSLWLLTFMAGYFAHLPNTIRLYGLAAPSISRIVRLLQEEEQSDYWKPDGAGKIQGIPSKVIFENVTFQYPDGKTAVRNLSLEITIERQFAIVGEIGCGKTTFLKLLCGEFPPSQGIIRVQFDNGDCRDLWTQTAYEAYRKHLAYVPQEAFVSSDLFHINISLSDHAEDNRGEDVSAAAYWAELEADLAAFPDGLTQEIGEGGVNLSGGQRQRLNLARAFFSRRLYMVLDDTMSAVDTRTEATLMERLVGRGKGFVLVTHRTGELMRIGEVIVMKDGAIVEQGNPKALAVNSDSHFARVLRAYESEAAND